MRAKHGDKVNPASPWEMLLPGGRAVLHLPEWNLEGKYFFEDGYDGDIEECTPIRVLPDGVRYFYTYITKSLEETSPETYVTFTFLCQTDKPEPPSVASSIFGESDEDGEEEDNGEEEDEKETVVMWFLKAVTVRRQ